MIGVKFPGLIRVSVRPSPEGSRAAIASAVADRFGGDCEITIEGQLLTVKVRQGSSSYYVPKSAFSLLDEPGRSDHLTILMLRGRED